LSQKKRVNDLAKEVGMSGADLVKKLRDWGFNIKSAMSSLEEFEELQIRGMMEARGLLKEVKVASQDPSEAAGGLVLRRKKKKKADGEGDAGTGDEVEVQPPQRVGQPVVETRPSHPAPSVAFEPTARPQERETRGPLTVESEPAPALPHTQPIAAQSAPTIERDEPEVRESQPPSFDGPNAPIVEIPRPPTSTPQPHAPRPLEAQPQPTQAASTAPTAPPETEGGVVKPQPSKIKGTVIGRIDLSKIRTTAPKKPTSESRRLRSKDDVAPDVQPTLGHDKKRALVRGDRGPRGQLSSGQLRERESSRFLRRNATSSGGQRGSSAGGPRMHRREEGSSSPLSGQVVQIDVPVTLKKLADRLSVKANELITLSIRRLGMDLMKVNLNSVLDEDTATLLANEFNVDLKITHEVAAETALIDEIKKKRTDIADENLINRPPTVAFLGHVDHGKTTLIDAIRESRVAEGEAGGITQHIGAYQVTTKKGHTLTIIDTPGHAAFTAMRARGARAVDIVVLVVASDDGPMPSTEEALAHANAAKVPLVVALTKIDKAESNVEKAKQSMTKLGLVPEEWGGDIAMIPVSAVKRLGVEELLERVFLESEVLQLQCHPKGPAQGIVLEAEKSEGKGIVAHLLIQDGTLNRGDVILAGEGYGKVRSMQNDRGKTVDQAPPSMPVEVTGLSELPGIGESFYVVESLAKAKEVAEERQKKSRALSLVESRAVTADSLAQRLKEQAKQSINLVVRADVQGSVEVLKSALSELKHEEVEVKVLFAGVGAVTENDVNLASTSTAIIIAFHVGVNDKARAASERLGTEIRYYEVIYELLDHMRELMEGTLAPEIAEEVTAHVEVRALFKSSKVGNIAGCHVLDGTIQRDSRVRLMRDGRVIFNGQLGSLRREKDEAKEVRAGFDCGLTVKDYQDVRPGDVLEAFKIVKKKRTLGDTAGV
jgi:translation initiation factor IF-2